VRKGRVQTVTLMRQSVLARTAKAKALLRATARCCLGTGLARWLRLSSSGGSFGQNLREVAPDGGSERDLAAIERNNASPAERDWLASARTIGSAITSSTIGSLPPFDGRRQRR
jgi:hypothetical protein